MTTTTTDLDAAIDLPVLIAREEARRDRNLHAAAAMTRKLDRRDGNFTVDSEKRRFRTALANADVHDQRVRRFQNILAEKRAAAGITSVREASIYGPGSGNSYFADHVAAAHPAHPDHHAAVRRQQQYARGVSHDVRSGTSEGRRAVRVAETRGRGGIEARSAEVRAMTSGTGSGGAFVTPSYAVEDWATFRTAPPAFAAQATRVDDPGFGMEMLIPAFDAAPTVAAQASENTAVANSSPGGRYLQASLVTLVGELDVSTELMERAGPVGFDTVIGRALTESLASEIDSFVLSSALAGAGTVAGASTFSAAGLWGDLALAGSQMLTTAGTVLEPTHLFAPFASLQWLSAQTDPAGRPLFTPVPSNADSPIVPGPDGRPPVGFTGERVLYTSVFRDGNIPASGANAQLIVAHPAEVFLQVSEPALRVLPETLAQNLETVVQLYAYVGVIVRHPAAVQVVSGAAYPAAPTFS